MKIIMIGAGVLGSLYAAKLQETNHPVTLLARGKRLSQVQIHGIILEDSRGRETHTPVETCGSLDPEMDYDLAIVLVRKNQLDSVLPMLSANRKIPSILFMVNNCSGPAALIEAVGRERVLLGFPGAGGERDGVIVRYRVVNPLIQPTTIGELDGARSARIKQIASMLSSAGFPTVISGNMDAWLKTHVAVVSPVANAIYLAGGSNYRLAHTQDGLALMMRAVREGFNVLRSLHIPITPAKFKLIRYIPEPLLVALLQNVFDTKQAELVLARHANAARDEMQTLADEFGALALQAQIATPAIDLLKTYIKLEADPIPHGSKRIVLGS
jgi:2-dehydropantoate 2-reductase